MSADESPLPAVRARRLQPVRTLPDNHLVAQAEPCGACGKDVDPLRAQVVLAFEDGLRFFCDDGCTQQYRQGVRSRRKPTAPGRTPSGGVARARMPPQPLTPLAAEAISPEQVRWLWAGGIATFLSMALVLFEVPELWFGSALLCSVAAVVALKCSADTARELGVLAWLIGPLGVVAGAFSTYYARLHEAGTGFGQFGAALAAAAMLARSFFDADARRPIEQALAQLLTRLPSELHVPVKEASDPLNMALRRVESGRVHTGEEIVVMKNHVIAVDGVVQAGEAEILPYPGATTAIERKAGDPVLAGATVVSGALRVLSTRVGDDRALLRIARFGDPEARNAAPLLRLTAELTRWGAPAAIALSLGVLAIASNRGLFVPLSAASAVLIAAPLLALRRATQWSLIGAAGAAGARGIVFQHGAALDLAGHVTMVAMAPHRTLTEGKPEVVEIHAMGDTDANELLALVAAAEQAVGEHPIARAIGAFAAQRGVPSVDVRRAVGLPGRGVTAIAPGGEEVVIGSRRMLLDHGVSVATADADAARAEAAGRTAIFVSIAGRVRAVLTLQDHLRVGARAAIQRMFDMDLEVVLLTGDQRGPIEELAAGLDIAHVKAELLPEERGHEVLSLREAGGRVAVIGYPIEDDAALSAADAGIALGAAGGPAGEKAVALVSEDVRDAAAALWIARAARDGALAAVRVGVTAFALVVAAAGTGLIEPGVAAVISVAVDAYAIRAGARLLHRIALRLPAWT